MNNLGVCVLIILFLWSTGAEGQVLSVNVGQSASKPKTITPIFNQVNEISNHDGYFFLRYDQFILSRKYYLGIDVSRSEDWNGFTLDGDSWRGYGANALRSIRIGLYGGYNLFHKKQKFALSPYLSIQLENTWATSNAFSSPSFSSPSDGVIVRGRGFYQPIERSSIIPAIGFDLDWNIFWRIHLKTNLIYSFGYDPNSKLIFDYTVDNVPQEPAEYETNGTGIYASVGLGFRLWNPKEAGNDVKRRKRKKSRR